MAFAPADELLKLSRKIENESKLPAEHLAPRWNSTGFFNRIRSGRYRKQDEHRKYPFKRCMLRPST
jgi:hypothetical protein